jgi:hypothetical protein
VVLERQVMTCLLFLLLGMGSLWQRIRHSSLHKFLILFLGKRLEKISISEIL